MIVLDTHVLLWLAEDHPRLGRRASRLADAALHREELHVSAISFWEIAMLVARLTLQTIARSIGAAIGLPDEVGHHLLWSNRGGWGLCDRGLQVAVRDVPRAEDCPVCGSGKRAEELGEDEARELEALQSRLRER